MRVHVVRTQYLRVMGRLYPDRQMTLRFGYLTETPPWSDREGDSPLRVETYAEDGAWLGSFPLRLSELCLEGGSGETLQTVRGFVPFHPRARRLVFNYHGQAVHELSRLAAPPHAEWTWQPGGEMAGLQTVTWAGGSPEGAPVEFFLRYSWDGGQSWSRLSVGTSEFSQEIDFDQLPGGDRCLLALVATDGINTTIVQTERFSLPRKACAALILQPLDGGRYPANQPVPLQGQGFWREENRPEREHLVWHCSSESGPVGHGRLGQLDLPPGEYTITLLAGSEAYQGQAEVTITVAEPDETGPESRPETGPEAGPGTGPETSPETAPGTEPETSPETGTGPGTETGLDTGLPSDPETGMDQDTGSIP